VLISIVGFRFSRSNFEGSVDSSGLELIAAFNVGYTVEQNIHLGSNTALRRSH
jgi:hypothetical protein